MILFDNFDGENGGASALNYAGFANFTVSGGTVDIIGQGGFGLSCVGGAGSCVDLDGSTSNGGTLTTTSFYSFNAGDLVTLSILLPGNQRAQAADEFSFGFNTSVATAFNNVITAPFGQAPLSAGNLGPGFFLGSGRPNATLGLVASGEPYTPATWAMMIIGFGFTGAAMRRRKVRTTITYA